MKILRGKKINFYLKFVQNLTKNSFAAFFEILILSDKNFGHSKWSWAPQNLNFPGILRQNYEELSI